MVQLSQIKQIFAESAHDVFIRTFEIAELMAMNDHLAEFDRELYEKGASLDPQAAPARGPTPENASASADNDPYPGGPASPPPNAAPAVKSAQAPAALEPVSKMRHITAETLRLAQSLAYEVPFEPTRETREFLDAYRYRLTRATLDCFMLMATDETAPGAASGQADVKDTGADGQAMTPGEQLAKRENHRYEDLVRQFMVNIAPKDAPSPSLDTAGNVTASGDGKCRVGAYRLAGLDLGAVVLAGDRAQRDLGKLRQPEIPARRLDRNGLAHR